MDHSISDELYSESLKLLNGGLGPNSQAYPNQLVSYDKDVDCFSNGDDGSFYASEEENNRSDLDREGQRRRDRFHTIGYRDGLIAGKEASAQEGFNEGFKESVLVGKKLGLVRGVTSALSFLPDGLKEKLVESQEDKSKFHSLYESVYSLSTRDALKYFYDSLMKNKPAKQEERAEADANMVYPKEENSDFLQNYSEQLKALILKTPKIEVDFTVDEQV